MQYRKYLLSACFIVLLWSVPALLSSSQSFYRDSQSFSWHEAWVNWNIYMIWAAMTPAIYYFAVRIPLRSIFPAFPLHMGLAILFSLVNMLLYALYIPWLKSGNFSWVNALETWKIETIWSLHLKIFSYWAILGVAWTWISKKEITAQKAHAAELKASLSDARLAAMNLKIQPHFLSNTLQTISHLSLLNQGQKAAATCDSLGTLLRRIAEISQEHWCELGEEFQLMDMYLDIQTVRYEDRLKIVRDIDPNSLKTQVPPLILQPLVENAIQHGIDRKLDSGHIGITVQSNPEHILIKIEDDGAGIPENFDLEKDSGMGLHTTIQRLKLLYQPGQANLMLKPREPGGTEVTLTLSKQDENRT